jgi:polyisoprenoid-binding protein YceI
MTKTLPTVVTLPRLFGLLLAGLSVVATGAHAGAASHEIDREQSTVTVRVSKAGVFRAFGDDHEVRAPLTSGSIDDGPQPNVRIVFNAAQLRVVDPGLSPDDRQQVQSRMLGPDVLDVARFPEIRFESTDARRIDSDRLSVNGALTLHGQTRTVVVTVARDRDRYRGTATIKQTAFGIKPVAVAGGTVKVKDEVTIEFDIATRAAKSGH